MRADQGEKPGVPNAVDKLPGSHSRQDLGSAFPAQPRLSGADNGICRTQASTQREAAFHQRRCGPSLRLALRSPETPKQREGLSTGPSDALLIGLCEIFGVDYSYWRAPETPAIYSPALWSE